MSASSISSSPYSIMRELNSPAIFNPVKSSPATSARTENCNCSTSSIPELPQAVGTSSSAFHSLTTCALASVATPTILSCSREVTTPTLAHLSSPRRAIAREIRVLLIDDQEIHIKMLTRNLKHLIEIYEKEKDVKFSLIIETANCADKGLELLKKQFFLLTIWDNKMPKKYGIEALKEFTDYIFTDKATPSAIRNFFNPPLFYTSDPLHSFSSYDLQFLERGGIAFLDGKQGEISLAQKLALLKAALIKKGIFEP